MFRARFIYEVNGECSSIRRGTASERGQEVFLMFLVSEAAALRNTNGEEHSFVMTLRGTLLLSKTKERAKETPMVA